MATKVPKEAPSRKRHRKYLHCTALHCIACAGEEGRDIDMAAPVTAPETSHEMEIRPR